MKKKLISFPIFSSRQSMSKQHLKIKEKSARQFKNQTSNNMLRIIREDIKRIKNTEQKKLVMLEKLFSNKQNELKKLKQMKSKNDNFQHKKIQISSSLQIKKMVKRSIQNEIHVQIPSTVRKSKRNTINIKKNTMDLKLSSQKVIVAKNRKDFSKINEQVIYEVRQNYLNSKFNSRKSRLQDITKANKKIYERINSQRSHYSNDDLNKSYQSNASLSRRLSNSKISHRSRLSISSSRSINSSRSTIGQKKSAKIIAFNNKREEQTKRMIKLQSKNINEIGKQHLQPFATLFDSKNKNRKKNGIKSGIKKVEEKQSSCKQNIQVDISMQKRKKLFKANKKIILLPSIKNENDNQQEGRQKIVSNTNPKVVLPKNILSTISENVVGNHDRQSERQYDRELFNGRNKIIQKYAPTSRMQLNSKVQNIRRTLF